MTVRKVVKENKLWHRVTELDELFYYTLYNFNAYWVIGKVDVRTAKSIKRVLNIDLEDYKIMLRSSELKHFLYSHYRDHSYFQRSIKVKDIKELNKMVNNASYFNWGNNDQHLLFERRYGNSVFQLIVEIDHRQKTLFGKSFRIKA